MGGDDGLDAGVMTDAVLGTAETFPRFEERLLVWSVEHGRRTTTGRRELPPWLAASVRAAAQRVFGSTGDCVDALAKAVALLRELDGMGERPVRGASVGLVPTSGPRASRAVGG